MVGSFDRRFLLRAGAAGIVSALIPFPEWFDRYGRAEAQTPLIRYSVKSSAGAAMLADYRNAVTSMTGPGRNPGDPCSWIFQWYTHEVSGDVVGGKAAAVAALDAARQPLANEMWSTCQAHGPGRPLRYFLPWHRMYLYFFERMVRQISGNPAFTMPYWDYFDAAQRAMPTAFIANPADPLYRSHRNVPAETGLPIDTGFPYTYTKDCFKQTDYLPAGGQPGFCGAINQDPHGYVHGMIGDAVGMGTVPYAANDPIFWLHHCSIDRMWTSWNSSGRHNPTDTAWLDQQFIFADEHCNRVVAKVSDFASTGPLGYGYDHLYPLLNLGLIEALRRLRLIAHWPPPVPGPNPLAEISPVVLGDKPVTVTLRPVQGNAEMVGPALARANEVRLTIAGLQANAAPGILYEVYVGTPTKAGGKPRRMAVGLLSFFDAVMPRDHEHVMEAAERPSASFDVTRAVKKLGATGPLQVTIVPHGKPAAEARPLIGEFQLLSDR